MTNKKEMIFWSIAIPPLIATFLYLCLVLILAIYMFVTTVITPEVANYLFVGIFGWGISSLLIYSFWRLYSKI